MSNTTSSFQAICSCGCGQVLPSTGQFMVIGDKTYIFGHHPQAVPPCAAGVRDLKAAHQAWIENWNLKGDDTEEAFKAGAAYQAALQSARPVAEAGEWVKQAAEEIRKAVVALSWASDGDFVPAVARIISTHAPAKDGLTGTLPYAEKHWPEPGDKMTFLNENGYEGERDLARKFFKVGPAYTVKDCDVHSWSHDIEFVEIPGRRFNGVMFRLTGEEK